VKPETLFLEWIRLRVLPVFGKERNPESTFAPAFHYSLLFVANLICSQYSECLRFSMFSIFTLNIRVVFVHVNLLL